VVTITVDRGPQQQRQHNAHLPSNHMVSRPPSHALRSSRSMILSYDELARATNRFSDANRLGEGGFGFVHKGILRNG